MICQNSALPTFLLCSLIQRPDTRENGKPLSNDFDLNKQINLYVKLQG